MERQQWLEVFEMRQEQPWQLCVANRWIPLASRDDLSCQMPTFLWRKRAVNETGSSWSNHQERAQHGATHDSHVDRSVQLSSYIHMYTDTCSHTHRSTVSLCLAVCLSLSLCISTPHSFVGFLFSDIGIFLALKTELIVKKLWLRASDMTPYPLRHPLPPCIMYLIGGNIYLFPLMNHVKYLGTS